MTLSASRDREPQDVKARVRCQVFVHGRVQGVYFRDFTRRHARRLGLVGYVRNLPDGTVEAVAEGSREALESLLTELRVGPPAAEVTRVEVYWGLPSGDLQIFEVRW